MSHFVETMAWASERPWHGLGHAVSNDLSPLEMMRASKTDWSVDKADLYAKVGGEDILLSEKALYRTSDKEILDIVGDDWVPNQNEQAFGFFKEFVEAGSMKMETAGSLQKGKTVWALAKVGKDFTLFNGDRVEGYLLFSNPHQYGKAIDVRFTAIRVVCWNTHTAALNSRANQVFRASHRSAVDYDAVKETIGVAEKKMDEYQELATFLGSKKLNLNEFESFLGEVFPSMSTKVDAKGDKKTSRNFKQAQLALTHQPGVEFAEGTWWQALNAVTFTTDHLMGRNADSRVNNMWYGPTKDLKARAENLAVKYAKVA